MESEEFKAMQTKAIAQLKAGLSLTGKDGAFVPLLKQFLEAALDAGMSHYVMKMSALKVINKTVKGPKCSERWMAQ